MVDTHAVRRGFIGAAVIIVNVPSCRSAALKQPREDGSLWALSTRELRMTGTTATERISDYKALYRKLERTIDRIEQMEDTSTALSACLRSLVDNFYDDLGFVGGRIYEREGDDYVLLMRYGRSKRAAIGYRIPITYRPIQTLLRDGLIIRRRGDSDFDETIEGAIGVSKFAAFSVGDNHYIISLTIKGPID